MKDLLNLYMALAVPFMQELEEIQAKQEKHKKEILAEWRNSMNYPRKKKKEVRKRLRVEWAIANWNPLEF